MNSAFVRVTAAILSALFLTAAAAAAMELWREGELLGNPKLKIAAAWLTSGAIFLAIALRGWRWRRHDTSADSR